MKTWTWNERDELVEVDVVGVVVEHDGRLKALHLATSIIGPVDGFTQRSATA